MPRFYCPAPLITGQVLELPAGAARHVQVLRLQPGDAITLFNAGPGWEATASTGGEFEARVVQMGRSHVTVEVGVHHAVERAPARQVHLAIGMPANERMDWLVEKATELGVASIQPLMTERSVLRLSGERAEKKVAHWQSVAVSACEQCGGNRVPTVLPVQSFNAWLAKSIGSLAGGEGAGSPAHANSVVSCRWVLSLQEGTVPLLVGAASTQDQQTLFLCGPEGGLSFQEEQAAMAKGFRPTTLGPRVLRSETAALAALAAWTIST